MQDQATVLLVSVGETIEKISAELDKLNVRVLDADLPDAEERIEEDHPDLVVLIGARGAMELATLIEGAEGESTPRMVIAAARKDLAKLRGLNRDVVVSLFALETGEEVVAQRIESLARRAARRRTNSQPPPAVAKRTSLGLPNAQAGSRDDENAQSPAQALGRIELKRSGTGPTRPAVEESAPGVIKSRNPPAPTEPSIGKKATLASEAKAAAHKAISSPLKQPQGETPAMPFGLSKSPRPAPAAAQKPEAPANKPAFAAKAAPEEKAVSDEETESSLVSDSELLSLRPSEIVEPELPAEPIPASPAVPRIDKPAGSLPPQLPEQEQAKRPNQPSGATKAQATTAKPPRATRRSGALGPHELGEFDISAAEEALENLDSVKVAITDELRDTAQKAIAASEARSSQAEAKAEEPADAPAPAGLPDGIDADDISMIEAISIAPGEPSDPPQAPIMAAPAAPQLDAPSAMGTPEAPAPADLSGRADQTGPTANDGADASAAGTAATSPVAPQAEQMPPEESLADDIASSLEHAPLDAAEQQTTEPRHTSPVTTSEDVLDDPLRPKKKSGNGALIAATAAIVAVAAGAAYASGLFSSAAPNHQAKETPHAAQQPAASPTATAPSQPAPSASSAPAQEAAAQPEADTAEAAAEADKPEAAPTAAQSAAGSGLENPFLVPDTNKASCDSLLNGNKPTPSEDPVRDASVAWEEARKLIVHGKLDEAHLKMCQAVSLNPESAAVEGLAHLYLDFYSPAQALYWAEKAEALRPGQREIGNLMGDAYSLQGKSEQARGMWLKMLNLTGEEKARLGAISKDYSVDAGRHLRRGDLRTAERWYRRAVLLDPDNLPGLLGLAKTFYRAEQPDHAQKIAMLALQVSDLIPELHVLLGDIALDAGDKDEARKRYERALETRPGFYPAKRGLSQVE